jgi:uncharacterized secreted protein with C-terminal beta-propeller domain
MGQIGIQMKKHVVILSLALAIAVSGLVGCAPAAEPAAPPQAPLTTIESAKNLKSPISVTMTVDCANAVNAGIETSWSDPVIMNATYKVEKDSTVLAAIDATGIPFATMQTPYGYNVTSIGGIDQKEDSSGRWAFTVNDEPSPNPVDKTKLKDGDVVKWAYVVQ